MSSSSQLCESVFVGVTGLVKGSWINSALSSAWACALIEWMLRKVGLIDGGLKFNSFQGQLINTKWVSRPYFYFWWFYLTVLHFIQFLENLDTQPFIHYFPFLSFFLILISYSIPLIIVVNIRWNYWLIKLTRIKYLTRFCII